MVKFCDECGSILTPSTASGELLFHCACGKIFKSTPEDSLRYEEYPASGESRQKYEVFVSNSPHDPAVKRIRIECPNCFMPYLSLIYIGVGETPVYTCACGKRYTVQDVANMGKKSEAVPAEE